MFHSADLDVALKLLDLHRSAPYSCSMTDLPLSSSQKKMKYIYDKYQNEISPSQVSSRMEHIKDTEIGHVDMSEFIKRVEDPNDSNMQRLLDNYIHHASFFLVAALELEFVLACANHFDKETRIIRNDDGEVIVHLDAVTIEKVFRIPPTPVYIEISRDSAAEYYVSREKDCKYHINRWISEPGAAFTRWSKLYRCDFKCEIGDTITLLSRMMGLEHSKVFEPRMYKFIMLVRQSQHISWGEIISDILCEQLAAVPSTMMFYMNSYLVYIAASHRHFPGLSTKGDRSLIAVWDYYDQLPLRPNRFHYRRVQGAFFGHYMCLFDKTLKNRRVSYAAREKVSEYGFLFLQFPTFTYMRVGCYSGQPYMLPRYPTNKIILMELGRQIMAVHAHQSVKHKVGMGISTYNP